MKYLILTLLAWLAACCSHARPVATKPDAATIEPASVAPSLPERRPQLFTPMQLTINPFTPATPGGGEPSKQRVECGTSKYCVPVYRFSGEVDEDTVRDVLTWLETAKAANPTAVVLELTTPGGRVDHGFRIIRAIEDLDVPVYCVVEHEAMSEGYAILQACTKRYMTKRSQLMTHKPYLTMQGRVSFGIEDLESRLSDLRSTARAFAEHCSAKMKITLAEYEARVSNRKDWYMDWQEAVAVGAVDRVVKSVREVRDSLRCSGSLP